MPNERLLLSYVLTLSFLSVARVDQLPILRLHLRYQVLRGPALELLHERLVALSRQVLPVILIVVYGIGYLV